MCVQTIVAFLVSTVLMTALIAVTPLLLKIPITRVSFGFGRKIFSVGIVEFHVLLTGGSVSCFHTEIDSETDFDKNLALNVQPKYKQLMVALGGPILLITFSTVVLGWRNMEYFADGFYQIVSGALSPFNEPQLYLEHLPIFIEQHSFLQLVALVSTKVAALNLLPLSAFSGGQALEIVFSLNQSKHERIRTAFLYFSLIIAFYISVVWVIAFLWFCSSS